MKPAKIVGHHIHPMLIVFPLGLLAVSVFFDIAYLATHGTAFATIAFWDMLAGIVGGLAAAVFGFWDWLTITPGTRAKRIGAWHGLNMVFVVGLFAASWLLRRMVPMYLPSSSALTLSFVAVVLALIGGWLGGELVERLGIAVSPNAGPNAPSSLHGDSPPMREPARGRTAR
jgi:uncharacterized membrane protein